MDETPQALARQKLWQRLRKNISVILGGRAIFGLVNLAAAAIAVRACGVEAFGVVALLHAYIQVFAGLLRFDTWAAVTRYGVKAADTPPDLRRLLGFTLRLDVLAFFVSVLLAGFVAPFAGQILHWPEEVISLAPWYAVNIIFITGATATGFLRLIDRFAVLAQQHGLNAVIRLIGALLLWVIGGDAFELTLVWGIAGIVSGAYMMGIAWREALRRDLMPTFRGRWSELSAGFPNIWRFVTVTNVDGMISTVMNYGVTLMVGAILGTVGASLFQIAWQSTDFMRKLSNVLGPIFFPEITKMEAKGNRPEIRRLIDRTLWVAAIWLAVMTSVYVFGTEPYLRLLFGPETVAVTNTMILCGIAAALFASGFTFEPSLMSIGKESSILKTTVFASAVAVPSIIGLTYAYGLSGAGIGLLLWQILVFTSRLIILKRALREDL